jgi:restriction endonuclease S subunit
VSGPFGSSLKSSDYTEHGIPLIRISDLESFSINRSNLVFISESSHRRIIGSELRHGDLVLSKVGNSIGIVSILDSDFSKANISENNIGIRFHPGASLALKHFLLAYLNCHFGQREILRRRSGNAQPKLNINDVYGLELPMASEALQEEVSEIIQDSQGS